MAAEQEKRHELGRTGEELVNGLIHGQKTAHKAPFDIVDFTLGYAYEVKAMSGMSRDLKIHISDNSMARKQAFAEMYNLRMVLVAVVIHDPTHVEIYSGELKQSLRISQMLRVYSIEE